MRGSATLSRLAWLVGGIMALLAAAAQHWPPPVQGIDLNQTRLDRALPAPQVEQALRQTFTPQRDGLREVELLLARAEAEETGGEFTAILEDDAGILLAQQSWPADSLRHNQALTLRFPRQPHSANRRYTLTLQGSAANPIGAWGYSLNIIPQGTLQWSDGNAAPAAALRLVTRYELGWGQAVAWLGQMVWAQGGQMLLALAFLALPGCLLLPLFPAARRWDSAAWWGAALAVGAAIWPLLWFWLTLSGGRWQSWSLWLALIAGWLIILAQIYRQHRHNRANATIPSSLSPLPSSLFLLLLLSLCLRLLAVRDLAFPPWVDASRHALITQAMADSGQFLDSYRPLLPVERAPYHYGFHAIAASLKLMGGGELPALLLYLGQLLNGLAPLVIYAAAWLVTRHRGGSLTAAFLAAVPFFFPAYYATWGRFTQLAATLILPVLLALVWQMLRGGPGWRRGWWLVGVLVAGIFFIHFRVFLLALPFVGLVWLCSRGRRGRWLLAAAGLALALTLPRWLQLLRLNRGARLASAIPGYNEFPLGYVQAGWERWFLVAAGIGLLLAFYAAARRRAWAHLPLTLALWVGGVLAIISGRLPGLPASWLVNLNSAYITLFVPLAWLFGVLAWRGAHWLNCQRPAAQVVARLLAGGVLTTLLLFGGRQQITILNEQTILAQAPDAAALRWLAAHTPPAANVAISSWRWLGSAWAGSDGGAWILPLTGRQTTTPPVDYIYDRELALEVAAFNEAASQIADWSAPAAADWLRQQGVTHIFVGAKGGFFDPAPLSRNPQLTLLYSHAGAFIFALKPLTSVNVAAGPGY